MASPTLGYIWSGQVLTSNTNSNVFQRRRGKTLLIEWDATVAGAGTGKLYVQLGNGEDFIYSAPELSNELDYVPINAASNDAIYVDIPSAVYRLRWVHDSGTSVTLTARAREY